MAPRLTVSARAALRRSGVYALWWAGLYALWWLYVGSWSAWDAVWGAGLATLATAAAVAASGTRPGSRRLGRRWAAEVGSAVPQVVLDFAVLCDVLVRSLLAGRRGPHGRFVTRHTDETGEDASARRAWATLVATLSPNAYVIDVHRETGEALLHDLRVWSRSEEPL